MSFQGGSGVLIGTPNIGLLPPNPSPYVFPVLQEVSVEFKGDLKGLYGQYQISMDTLRGKVKITGKGKMIVPTPDVLSQTFFGLAVQEGMQSPVFNESYAPAASITPINPTANVNLGVLAIYLNAAGQPTTEQMTLYTGAGAPPIGSYKFVPASGSSPVTNASFVFNASETATTVLISYSWPDTTHGLSLLISNQLIGEAPQLALSLFNSYKGKRYAVTLNAVMIGSFSIPTKQEDHWLSDFDFEASADGSGNVGTIEGDL